MPIDREAWSDAFGPLMPELGADVISRAGVSAVAKAWKTTGSASVLSLLLATVMWSHGNATNRIDGIARMIEDHSTVALKLNNSLGRIGSGTEDELRAAYRSFTRPDHVAGLGFGALYQVARLSDSSGPSRWWAAPIAAFVTVYFIVRGGEDAWHGYL